MKGYAFEVPLGRSKELTGAVLSDQVRSLDWRARRAELIVRVPESVTEAVLQKLQTLLD